MAHIGAPWVRQGVSLAPIPLVQRHVSHTLHWRPLVRVQLIALQAQAGSRSEGACMRLHISGQQEMMARPIVRKHNGPEDVSGGLFCQR